MKTLLSMVGRDSRRALILLLLTSALWPLTSVQATDRITAFITVTNATTNGMTFAVNSNVRTFTNAPINPASYVATNADVTGCGSKTNLFTQINLNLFAQITPTDTGSNTFQLSAPCGIALIVSASAGWASVTYSTNVCSAATPIGVPFSAYYPSAVVRSNIASQLESDIDAYSTNSKFVDLTKTQTITGAKTFSNSILTNSPSISGSVDWLNGGTISNANMLWISGGTTNALIDSSGIGLFNLFLGMTTSGHSIWGFSDTLVNDTLFFSVSPHGTGSIPLFGATTNSVTFDVPVVIPNATISTNLSVNGTNTASYLKVLTNAAIAGNLTVTGVVSKLTFDNTNNFPAGADIAFGRFPVTSLANGNNAAVPVGTNVFVEVSGPSAAFTLNGIAGGRDGKLIVIVNQTGFDMTIAHQSGTDPTAANRIISMTGADRTTTGNGTATLIYSGSASRWLLINFDP